jgi:SAM-dependent methyltransferase
MLETAKRKLKHAKNAKFYLGSVTDLPMEDSSFDVVISNQVIHHLEDSSTYSTRVNTYQMFREVKRVLKFGGIFIINTTFPDQYKLAYWYADFIPKTIEIFNKKLPSLQEYEKIIKSVDLKIVSVDVLVDPLIGNEYFNPKGPLFKEWRDGDSGFSVLDDSEIESMMNDIEKKNNDGSIQKFIEEKEIERMKLGHSTFIVCKN